MLFKQLRFMIDCMDSRERLGRGQSREEGGVTFDLMLLAKLSEMHHCTDL